MIMSNPIRTAVIDDHPLFREGVTKLLARTPGIEIVGDGSTANDAVNIAQQLQPNIILLDLSLPDNGVGAVSTIAREHPGVRIIILTASESETDVAAMLQLGVHGYLLKGCTGQEIVRAVQRVHAGEFYVTPALAARLLTQMSSPATSKVEENSEELSSREELILAQVSKGLTNKEIARGLNLREKTVKHYMTNIMQKLGVRNRLEAVLMGQKRLRSSKPSPHANSTASKTSGGSAFPMKSTMPS
jgi:DNA-binding NarL/FixJ family response regulator